MRMKLSYKIFGVNLVVSFVLIFLMGSLARFYAVKHFKENEAYFQEQGLERLSRALAHVYSTEGSWERFDGPKPVLEDLARKVLAQGADGGQGGLPLAGPPPEHVALLTAEKKWKAGARMPVEKMMLKPVEYDGKPVGWVAMAPHPGPRPPSFNERLNLLYTISIIVFVVTGIVSYLLSRHILSPIDRVAQGTRALADFRFDTRIDVKTGDELESLASVFNQMAQTLEKYQAMNKQWLVNISHELRTPVSILKGEIEAIRDGIRTPSDRRIRSLYEEIICLEKLISDLHLLSSADAKLVNMRHEPVQPLEILKGVLSLFDTRFSRAGLGVDLALQGEGVWIAGSRDRLKQVFFNIFENNLRYTSRPGNIRVRTRNHDKGLMIAIADTGPGVPPACLDKLFDRLYRVDRSRSRELGGTGLGLSICKTIVLAHKGRVSAQNAPGQGLEIRVWLPGMPEDTHALPVDC